MEPGLLLPAGLRALWDRLQGAAPTYLVGGCLRDALLGLPTHDFDLATALRPEDAASLARSAGWHVVPTGVRFGTVTVLTDPPVEVTTFRADGRYTDRRHPDQVRFGERIEDDLGRRDFTVNAMALAGDGRLVDPYGGRRDLRERRLRTVGDPAERFREDPLRMWRAVRFLSQLEGWSLDPATREAIVRHRAETLEVSRERVRDELLRMLGYPSLAGLRTAVETRLLYIAIPELAALEGFAQHHPQHDTDVLVHTLQVVAGVRADAELRLAALLHDIAKPQCVIWLDGVTHFHGHDRLGAVMAGTILRGLRLPNEAVARVVALVGHHMFPWTEAGPRGYRRLLAELGHDGFTDLVDLHVADVRGSRAALVSWHLPDGVRERIDRVLADDGAGATARLAVDGHDVMRAFSLGQGPEVGQLLRTAREWVWEDPARNDREAILAHLAELRGAKG